MKRRILFYFCKYTIRGRKKIKERKSVYVGYNESCLVFLRFMGREKMRKQKRKTFIESSVRA